MRIKKSVVRRVGSAFVLAVLVGAVVVGAALAAGVNILTPPMQVDAQVYQDLDADGLNDPEELVGTFDVYDGMQTITVSWPATSFPAGANGSYRVSLWQNMTPFGTPTWKEITFGHHWADNPNGAQFTVGPFGPGQVCVTCPSMFMVQPETYTLFFDPSTQTYEYEYTALPSSLSQPAALEESEQVIIHVTHYAPPEPEEKEDKNECVPTNDVEDNCLDGLDNDCNGLTDGRDPWCLG